MRGKRRGVAVITNDGNYSSRFIILHSTISYTRTSVEEGDIQESANFDCFLPIESSEDVQQDSLDEIDNRRN